MPLLAHTSSPQPIQTQQDKAMAFLRDVIQLDVDHYKFTQTYSQTSQNTTYLYYKIEPKSISGLWERYIMNVEFYNDILTGLSIQPGSDCLAYTRARPDRFNETLGILERYQTWLSDPQVGEMAELLHQVGSEKDILQASGNLSVRIQHYSDIADFSFSNYFNGVEYTSVKIDEGSSTGRVLFSDNRAEARIGNTTIGVSQDQAVAIAQNYVNFSPVRGTVPANNNGITNLTVTGVKGVNLKSMQRVNDILYPYYDIEFNVEQLSFGYQVYGVNVGANDGEVWGAYSYTTSASSGSTIIPVCSFLVLLAIVAAARARALDYEKRNRKNRADSCYISLNYTTRLPYWCLHV
jgi:hypothetical protein